MDSSELSFFESKFSGEQWESVASWVLNGGGMEVAEKAEEAAMSAESSKEYARNASTYANNARLALEKLQDMGVTAQSLPYGSGATVEKIIGEDGSVTLKFGIERGEKGETGSHATITTEKISGGHKVTFTDEDGTQSFDVMDGSADKMDRENPVGTGSFSLNRKAGTTVGSRSFAEGSNTEASGNNSHAEGYYTEAVGYCSHAEGFRTTANGQASHAEGYETSAGGDFSHAEGYYTVAGSPYQHAQGKFNVEDINDAYADIVGWGDGYDNRKNISALDTNGNLHLKGKVFIDCEDDSTGGTELGDSDVFIAIYGTTTYQEIKDAYDAGKAIIAIRYGKPYLFNSISSSNALFFGLGSITEFQVTCTPQNQWGIGSWSLETTSNKKDAIDDTNKSSASYYPTTKAVYDFATPRIKIASVSLDTSWTASGDDFVKTVTIAGTTANSKIDVQPDATVIKQLIEDGVTALYFANNNGTIQAVSVGAKPTVAISVQVSITEVTT